MKKSILPTLLLAAAGALSTSTPAIAGAYGDTLTKCLVQSTTPADKATLVG